MYDLLRADGLKHGWAVMTRDDTCQKHSMRKAYGASYHMAPLYVHLRCFVIGALAHLGDVSVAASSWCVV